MIKKAKLDELMEMMKMFFNQNYKMIDKKMEINNIVDARNNTNKELQIFQQQKPKGELQLTNPISNNKDMNYHIDWLNDKIANITENKTDFKILLSFSNTSTMNLPSNLEITEAPNSSIHFSKIKLQGTFASSKTINKSIYLKTGKLNAGIYIVYIQLRDSTNQENIGEQLKLEVRKGIGKTQKKENDFISQSYGGKTSKHKQKSI